MNLREHYEKSGAEEGLSPSIEPRRNPPAGLESVPDHIPLPPSYVAQAIEETGEKGALSTKYSRHPRAVPNDAKAGAKLQGPKRFYSQENYDEPTTSQNAASENGDCEEIRSLDSEIDSTNGDRSSQTDERAGDLASSNSPASNFPPISGSSNHLTVSPSRRQFRRSVFGQFFTVVSAHLVGETNRNRCTDNQHRGTIVVEATRIKFWNNKNKALAVGLVVLSVTIAIIVPILLEHRKDYTYSYESEGNSPSVADSPSKASYSPTLEIVQKRGYLKCGLENDDVFYGVNETTGEEFGFTYDLCRAIAAVVLGNPEQVESETVNTKNRFTELFGRNFDVLLLGDTHTMEREVKESTTGAGFAFSVPYIYDGLTFAGIKSFVECANEKLRHQACADLVICVQSSSTHYDYVRTNFPRPFIHVEVGQSGLFGAFINGSCNVVAGEARTISEKAARRWGYGGDYHVGSKSFSKEPLAIVTRKGDKGDLEWSGIVNWVLQALIFGEKHGLAKEIIEKDENLSQLFDSKLGINYTHSSPFSSRLDFLKAIYHVGNFGEIYERNLERKQIQRSVLNNINNGTTGLLYTIPFGNSEVFVTKDPDPNSPFGILLNRGTLLCGVSLREGFATYDEELEDWVGMDVDYCYTLSAAIFQGDLQAVEIIPLSQSEDERFEALKNGTVDVLTGSKVNLWRDIENEVFEVSGFTFSTPYYFESSDVGQEDRIYALATRSNDGLFSSFVSWVVMATIYAYEEGLTSRLSGKMPLATIFGPNLKRAFQDAIASSGSYDFMYYSNLEAGKGTILPRGRNDVNRGEDPQPQLFNFAGLEENFP